MSSKRRSSDTVTLSKTVSREYDRLTKLQAETRKVRQEQSIEDKRRADKWETRVEKNNILKNASSNAKLSPSIDEWLDKSKQRQIMKSTNAK